MTMIVQAEGIEVQEGDRLLAYADGELCGVAEALLPDVLKIQLYIHDRDKKTINRR